MYPSSHIIIIIIITIIIIIIINAWCSWCNGLVTRTRVELMGFNFVNWTDAICWCRQKICWLWPDHRCSDWLVSYFSPRHNFSYAPCPYIYVPLAANFPSYTFRKQNGTVTESDCCQVMHGSFYGLSLITQLNGWVHFEKLTAPQLAQKFSAFYETRRFITAFTRAHQVRAFVNGS